MSARISGVKNFESKATSLLRGLPFSQVQSQSEKGSIFSFFAGAAVASVEVCAATSAGAAVGTSAFTGITGASAAFVVEVAGADELTVEFVAAVRLFNSASSS